MRRVQAVLTEDRRAVLAGLSLTLVGAALVAVLVIQSGSVTPPPGASVAEEATSVPEPVRLPTPWRVPPTPGWVTYRSADGAYVFATPPEWTALSLIEEEARDRVVALAAENPGWRSYVEAASEAGLWQEIQVVAVGPDSARFTISHQIFPHPVTLDFYAGLVESQIVSLGATDVALEEVTLSGEDARRIGFDLSFLDEGDREVEVRGALVLTIQGGGAYALSFTAPGDVHARYASLFAEMAARFSFVGGEADQGSEVS